MIFLPRRRSIGLSRNPLNVRGPGMHDERLECLLASKQVLLCGKVKRVLRERVSKWRSREGQHSRETRFACPNRRACSQAKGLHVKLVKDRCDEAPAVQKLDSVIHQTDHYPADKYKGKPIIALFGLLWMIFLPRRRSIGLSRNPLNVRGPGMHDERLECLLASKQVLLCGKVKRVLRERVSKWRSREGQHSRETRFACPNRRACSQAKGLHVKLVKDRCDEAPAVQKLDSVIHQTDHYPADKYKGKPIIALSVE